jgi:hypothetical protein
MRTTGKVSYKTKCRIIRRRSFLFIVSLVLILTFILAACGSNGGTTTGSAGSTPTSVKTTGTGNGSTATGCPNNVAVSPPQATPNVTLHLTNANSTTAAHTGDLIEVLLPFGQQWMGPTTSQGGLQLQTPYGYSSPAQKMCVWHFIAQGTGITQLNFSARAICKSGQLCPQYILSLPFTIDVK